MYILICLQQVLYWSKVSFFIKYLSVFKVRRTLSTLLYDMNCKTLKERLKQVTQNLVITEKL